MKYLKSYKIFESIADYTAKIKEALEIYAEDLPFMMDNISVYSHVDTDTDGNKRIAYSVAYIHVDPSLLGLTNAEAYSSAREQIDIIFRKFARKYDMEYSNMDLDFDLDSRYAPDDLEVRVGFDLIKKLETFSNDRELEEAIELYAEGLPFEMNNVYVTNKTAYDFDNKYDIYEVSYEHVEADDESGNVDIKKHVDLAFAKFAKRYDMEYGGPGYRSWYGNTTYTGASVDSAHDEQDNPVPYVTFSLKQIRGKKPYNPKPHNESISDFNCKNIIDMLVLQLEDNGEFELDYSYGDRGISVDWSMSPESYQWYINNKESLPTEDYVRYHSKSHFRNQDVKSANIPTSLLIYEDYSKNTEMSKLAIEAYEVDFDKGVECQNNIEVEVIDINTRIFDRLGKKFDIKFEVVGATYHKTHIIVEILMYDK